VRKDEKLSESKWLVMNVRGFESESQARSFAHQLKLAVQLAAASVRLGVDCGADVPTSGLGKYFRQQLFQETGYLIRDNIHGIDVFEDDEHVGFFSLSAEGQVLVQPEPFFDGIAVLHDSMAGASQEVQDILLLLNFAL